MFSGVLIGFLVAVSGATWVYTKTMRQTGNNTKSSLITAGVFGLIGFIVTVTLVATIDSMLAN